MTSRDCRLSPPLCDDRRPSLLTSFVRQCTLLDSPRGHGRSPHCTVPAVLWLRWPRLRPLATPRGGCKRIRRHVQRRVRHLSQDRLQAGQRSLAAVRGASRDSLLSNSDGAACDASSAAAASYATAAPPRTFAARLPSAARRAATSLSSHRDWCSGSLVVSGFSFASHFQWLTLMFETATWMEEERGAEITNLRRLSCTKQAESGA